MNKIRLDQMLDYSIITEKIKLRGLETEVYYNHVCLCVCVCVCVGGGDGSSISFMNYSCSCSKLLMLL